MGTTSSTEPDSAMSTSTSRPATSTNNSLANVATSSNNSSSNANRSPITNNNVSGNNNSSSNSSSSSSSSSSSGSSSSNGGGNGGGRRSRRNSENRGGRNLQLQVLSPGSPSITVDVPDTGTVLHVKQAIFRQNPKFPAALTRLVLAGKALADNATLTDLELRHLSVLNCIRDRNPPQSVSDGMIRQGPLPTPSPSADQPFFVYCRSCTKFPTVEFNSSNKAIPLVYCPTCKRSKPYEKETKHVQCDYCAAEFCQLCDALQKECGCDASKPGPRPQITFGKLRFACMKCNDPGVVLNKCSFEALERQEAVRLVGRCWVCHPPTEDDDEDDFQGSSKGTDFCVARVLCGLCKSPAVYAHSVRFAKDRRCPSCQTTSTGFFVQAECVHAQCLECYLLNLHTSIAGFPPQLVRHPQTGFYTIKCPMNCVNERGKMACIHDVNTLRLCGEDTFRKFRKVAAEMDEEEHRALTCPGCKKRFIQDWEEGDRAPVKCVHCNVEFCPSCKATPCECDAGVALSGSKRCPQCFAAVIHYYNSECHHIGYPSGGCPGSYKGSPCGLHWCYCCREPYQNGRATCRCPTFCEEGCGCPVCPKCNPTWKEGDSLHQVECRCP